jgi:DNA polymerase-1
MAHQMTAFVKNQLADDTVFLIDGSGYIFRAYYAVRPLSSSKGVPTNAVYGFTTMLLKLLKEHRPSSLAVAFDMPAKTFRHALYAGYKANRPPPPEDLVPQFELIHRVVEAFGIRTLILPGYEADDLLGTFARMAREEKRDVVIVTGDKDLMQLVEDRIWLLDELRASKSGTEEFVDTAGVTAKFGVGPSYVADVLALAGDASDGVPGVPGIGEKTAVDLVKQYGHLESILNAAPLIPQKSRREKLINESDMARLCMKLVTIDAHVPVPWSLTDLIYKGSNAPALIELFKELDFKRLLEDPFVVSLENGMAKKMTSAEMPPVTTRVTQSPATLALTPDETTGLVSQINRQSYRAITNIEALNEVVSSAALSKRLAIDTETNGLDPQRCDLVGISLSWAEGDACYIPIAHQKALVPEQLPLDVVRRVLDPLLSDPSRAIVAQNAKFDWAVLTRAGFKPFEVSSDPMLASYLLYADTARHGLDELSRTYLSHQPIAYEEVCGKGRSQITFDAVSLDAATNYAAEDADLAFRLSVILEDKLKAAKLNELYYAMELPLEGVLARMEKVGVRIDVERLERMSEEFNTILRALEKQSHELANAEFNLASPKQVADVLFVKLGLEKVKKTKTGASTDSDVLEHLAASHPLPKLLLEHRMIAKLKGTYVDALPRLINPFTGRVHTSFNQAIAATGRLSSSEPNLQNIPIRMPEGRRIREAFVADRGNTLVSLDYSQVELRILAHVSEDAVMLDSFLKGEDVHRRTASEIFDVPTELVTKEQRGLAKTINFGLLYGMGQHRLAQTLGISRVEAGTYLARYYDRYKGIYNWQRESLVRARHDGEVRTLFDRRRLLPELRSQNRVLIQRAERIAINTPIQGTAADIMKYAMIEADRVLAKSWPKAHMLLQVHDELLIECPTEEAESVRAEVSRIMSGAAQLKVPLVVESGLGASWAAAH